MRTTEIRKTGVRVSELGFGGGGLGELFTRITDRDADETLAEMWGGGVRYYDTAPLYGRGLSELRVGRHLRGQERDAFAVATKIGRVLRAPADPGGWAADPFWAGGLPFDYDFDYSYDAVMRSHADSLQRFGLNRIDVLVIHDLDTFTLDAATLEEHWGALERSGWRALEELRASGTVGAIGLGINPLGEIPRFLDAFDLDFAMVVGQYTLLDQAAHPVVLADCRRRGVDVVLAATFNSGILAQGPVPGATFNYQPADGAAIDRVARLTAVCERHGVPLQAAAIQFPLAHPVVRTVLVGPITAAQARENVRAYEHPIPGELWDELRDEGWIAQGAPTPADAAASSH